MTSTATPLAVAMMMLVLFLAIGIVLIPILDAALRRELARFGGRPANDNVPEAGDEPEEGRLSKQTIPADLFEPASSPCSIPQEVRL